MSGRAPCGTEAAYRRHRSRKESACEACKAAWAKRDYRRRRDDPRRVAQHRRYIAAVGRAQRRLAAMYPDIMAALLREELGPDDLVKRSPWKYKEPAS